MNYCCYEILFFFFLQSKSTVTPAGALRSSPDDDFLDTTAKYVRRGSVKEMSEKFIQKEASSTLTEKSSNYPKAGLILRTNSRKNSRDTDNEADNYGKEEGKQRFSLLIEKTIF